MEDHMPTEVPERRRILVIDDEEGIRDMLSEVLSREGFDVLAAGDGKQGVEMARNSAFDLVILDLKLPGQDGGKVLPLLKSIDPNLRVIIITAYLSLMSPIEARERGAYDYIPKPIDVEDLKRRVKRACGARRCDSIAYQRYDRLVETIDPAVIPIIPENMAKTFNLIAVARQDHKLTVAMADPWDVVAIDTLRAGTGFDIEPVIADREEILKAIDKYYGEDIDLEKSIQDLVKIEDREQKEPEPDVEQLLVEADDAPVVRLVNLILLRALEERASDIHIEPREKEISVRIRVDGHLRPITPPPKSMQSAIISRVKILGNLDIAERRIPQDGRCRIKVKHKDVDIRISTLPTIHGEKVVMRLLDKSNLFLNIEDLGFDPRALRRFIRAIERPHGMLLVTGPTGSGKTTTLYSALNHINSPEKNIVTVENPVEYELEGINQVQARPEIGLTFAAALRSILRQDPDVVMIGEIRDLETAKIAVQAAQTGHLVFSTLHTNDAVSSIDRLINIGVEPYLIASSLNMVIAQRLVRRVCERCKRLCSLPEELLYHLGEKVVSCDKFKYYKGVGCEYCAGTGYRGRLAIYEIFEVDRRISELILSRASEGELRDEATRSGMVPLLENGLRKVEEGLTTVEEVLSAAIDEGADPDV